MYGIHAKKVRAFWFIHLNLFTQVIGGRSLPQPLCLPAADTGRSLFGGRGSALRNGLAFTVLGLIRILAKVGVW